VGADWFGSSSEHGYGYGYSVCMELLALGWIGGWMSVLAEIGCGSLWRSWGLC